MRRLAFVPVFVLPMLTGCDKPQQDTTNPDYSNQTQEGSDEIADYSKSACVGQQKKVATPGGEVAVTCKAEGDLFKLYVDDSLDVPAGDVQTAAASLDRISDTTALDGMVGTVENVFKILGAPAADKLDGGKVAINVVADVGADAWTAVGAGATIEGTHKFNGEQTIDEDFNAALANQVVGKAIATAADADEDPWVHELLGWSASIGAGLYGTDGFVDEFLENPNVAWGAEAEKPNPGANLLFGAFLYERFGAEFTQALNAEQANGWEGIEAAAKAKGKGEDRTELFKEWTLAIWFTDPGASYGFKFSGLPQAKTTIHKGEPEYAGESAPWGINYYMLNTGAEVPLVFTTEGDAFAFVGVRGEEGVKRSELVSGEALRVDLTAAETAVLVISSPTKSAYTLTLSEEAAASAEKAAAKAAKKAGKDAKKKGGKKGADKKTDGKKKSADKKTDGKKKSADKKTDGKKKSADKKADKK